MLIHDTITAIIKISFHNSSTVGNYTMLTIFTKIKGILSSEKAIQSSQLKRATGLHGLNIKSEGPARWRSGIF